jgi:uncharacterized protein (DUF1697 family)
MSTFVALLRAVNVGGTGKLPMKDLKAMCEEVGFDRVTTYIASGNVVFASRLTEAKVKSTLGARLRAYAGKDVGVLVRTAAEMAAVVARNPCADAPKNLVYAIFLDEAPPADAIRTAVNRVDEELALGARELYVNYPAGMGRSKLRIPAAKAGTARNMNTVGTLAEMAARLA